MLFLLASIISTSLLTLIFKLFERLKVDTFQSIVINYLTASLIGLYVNKLPVQPQEISDYDWFIYTIILGCLFIGIFNTVAFTAQKISITIATIANKMSLIIPVIAALILYGESISLLKVVGIALALLAIYLSSYRDRSMGEKTPRKFYIFPLIIFFGSGILDTLINFVQVHYLHPAEYGLFFSLAFGTAGFIGLLILCYRIFAGQSKINSKSIVGGIFLGTINYGSMHSIVIALESGIFQPSVFFPINNIGIVAFSTICAFILFKEKISLTNWLGVILCLLSIAMIALF